MKPTVLRTVRCSAILLLALGPSTAPLAEEAKPDSRLRSIDRSVQVGVRVSVKGDLREGRFFAASEIEIVKEPDDDQELRGSIDSVDPDAGTFSLLGITCVVDRKTRFSREPDHPADFRDLLPGLRVKVDGEREPDGTFDADKVGIRRNQDYRERRIVGRIEAILPSDRGLVELLVAGTPLVIDDTTKLVDARGRERQVVRTRLGIVDEDDLQFTNRVRLGKRVAVAGEVRLRAEWLDDPDLDDGADDELLVTEVRGNIGFLADLGPLFAYAEIIGEREFFIESENRFEDSEGQVRIGEAYVQFPGLLTPWLSVAIGRQKFNEAREWFYNTKTLDAVRLLADFTAWSLEASISRDIFDQTRNLRDQDLLNVILMARYTMNDDLEFEGYYIDREDRTEFEDSMRMVGLRLLGDPGRRWDVWADVARETGTVCTRLQFPDGSPVDSGQPCGRAGPAEFIVRPVRAYAFDVGATFRPRIALDPTFTLGYALGSGEGDEVAELPSEEQSGLTATSFRQTGLHRNRDKYHGKVSFRYYGEVLDPDLTNLEISTLGVGLRPTRGFSVDVVYHGYRQEEASERFHIYQIDENPNGTNDDVGEEWDLILGYEPSRKFELRLTAGIFRAGGAFDEGASSAVAVRLQTKFRF